MFSLEMFKEPMKPQKKEAEVNNRFYFRQDDDTCYKVKSHLQYMIENHIEEMDIFLAKRKTDSGYFFCKHFNEVGEKSEGGCGKMCNAYSEVYPNEDDRMVSFNDEDE